MAYALQLLRVRGETAIRLFLHCVVYELAGHTPRRVRVPDGCKWPVWDRHDGHGDGISVALLLISIHSHNKRGAYFMLSTSR